MLSLNSSTLALIVVALVGVRAGTAESDSRSGSQGAFAARVSPPQPPVAPPSPQLGQSSVTIVKAADGLFYLDGAVNGTPVRFLIDTGANMMVLTADDARRVGIRGNAPPTGRIDTANGPSTMDRVTLTNVAVGGSEAANVDAAVMRNGLAVSLLGQNMLSKLGRITLSNDTITIEQRR